MPYRGLSHDRFINTDTTYAACLGIAFHALSAYNEEAEHEAKILINECEPMRRINLVISDALGCSSEGLKTSLAVINTITRPIRLPVKLSCQTSDKGYENETLYTLDKASRSIVNYMLRGVGGKLKQLLNHNTHEYFLILSWNGEVFLGRGEETSIHLPLVKGVAFIHTHPKDYCFPSHQDLVSALDFFAEGGIIEMIASNTCLLIMRLITPLSENDYWSLQEISKCVARARKFEDYNRCLQSLWKLETIDAALYSHSWLG